MRKAGQIILTVGVIMLAAGFTLPFLVGAAIAPAGYDFLQLGGIVVAIVGWIVRRMGKKDVAPA